ncbi:isocitrate lyase/PEP mutase family protein [Bradyrhizobium sp. 166]|uniref:isocitrate lyase/PEP mutase family protein n=1 Tax=Bradyrhizobium sp. 166 TaxID=2782638 RepID=UPI001FF7A478|nr:isocitrate lyase/PEP mutase family protein [Bradyrhizobium sp. 166]
MSLPKACAPAWPRLAWSTSWPPTAHFRRFSREEAGFDGLWASGFELSVPYGLQDTSLISMTQHLDMLRAIAGRTRLPIVADIDAGYGNAISVIHTITEYERAGANAVVIGEAAITARSDPDFLVIARTEALIASLGEAEALRPARAEAGPDMILIHSKMTNPSEIESFSRAWMEAVPLVIVPNALTSSPSGSKRWAMSA